MKKYLLYPFLFLICFSCGDQAGSTDTPDPAIESAKKEANEKAMKALMKKHLDAVTNRDLETLESTITPKGDMQLILPSTEIIKSNDGFMQYHREWFSDTITVWDFKTEILNVKAGPEVGMAVTEVLYSEKERNGEPYFNRMTVSYDLIKIDDKWFVMKDHASSVEKSTDNKQ